jgi:hypothetical protein
VGISPDACVRHQARQFAGLDMAVLTGGGVGSALCITYLPVSPQWLVPLVGCSACGIPPNAACFLAHWWRFSLLLQRMVTLPDALCVLRVTICMLCCSV